MSSLPKHPEQSHEILPQQIISFVQEMFAEKADEVIGRLKNMDPKTREIAISTLDRYDAAMAANDAHFISAAQG